LQDNAWTVVQSRGSRRRERTRPTARYRTDSSHRSDYPSRWSGYPSRWSSYPSRWSSYPSRRTNYLPSRSDDPTRSGRRSYASVTRGNRLPDGGNFQRPPQDGGYRNPQRNNPRETYYGSRSRPNGDDGRRPNQRYVDRTHGEGTRPQSQRVQTDDPDFLIKVRTIHRLIKAVHHLRNVSHEEYPPSIDKMTHHLSTVIKPAVPNATTQTLIQGNAKNWAHTTMLILQQHYSTNIENDVNILSQFKTQEWHPPFLIASSWAKRNLGNRLKNETLDQVQAVIVAKLADLEPPTGPTERQPLINGLEQRAERTGQRTCSIEEDILITPTPPRLRPPRQPPGPPPPMPPGNIIQGVVMAQIHAPPATDATVRTTTATMTDPIAGDWSPFLDRSEGNDSPREATLSTQPQEAPPASAAPRDQRERPPPTCELQSPPSEEDFLDFPTPQEPPEVEMEQTDMEPQPSETGERTKTAVKTASVMHYSLIPTNMNRLRSSVQTRLQVRTSEKPPPSSHPPELQVCAPTRHPNTPRKLQDWNLHIREKWVIIGDSNVSRMPPFAAHDVQIDSFPGAKWFHAEALLEKATFNTTLEKLILSFGLNNRSQKDKKMPVLEMERTLKVAQQRFPEAEIYIPAINFSQALPQREQAILQHMNTVITGLEQHIPRLTNNFETESDNVHWSKKTAMIMLQHWNDYTN